MGGSFSASPSLSPVMTVCHSPKSTTAEEAAEEDMSMSKLSSQVRSGLSNWSTIFFFRLLPLLFSLLSITRVDTNFYIVFNKIRKKSTYMSV